jgi:hypothetical protein
VPRWGTLGKKRTHIVIDMSSTDAQPQLLPGMSASAWDPVFRVLTWIAGASTVLAIAFEISPLGSGYSVDWLIPIFVSYGLLYAALFARGIRAKKEVAAGYTTLWRENPTLPQLDAKTGAVVRKAGEPYAPRRRLLSGFTPTEDAQPRHGSPRPGFVRRATNIAVRIGGSVGILVVASIIWGSKDSAVVVWVWTIAAIALVAWVLGLAIGAGINRSRLAALTALDPHALVFTIISSDQFDDAFVEIAPDSAPRYPPVILGASASQKGLSLWTGRPPEQFGFIPWSWITSIQADTVYRNRTSYPSVLLSVRDPEDGKLVALPLPNPNADLLPMPSKAEASWIADELNQLLSGASGAKVL